MNLYRDAQANPDEPVDMELVELQQKIDHTVKALEKNSKAISRWFWKAMLAFNLVLGSLVFWFVVARLVH